MKALPVRHLLLALAFVALASRVCSAQGQRFRARVSLLGFDGQLALDTIAAPYEVNAAPAAVFRALDEAFKGFTIPVTTRDSASGLIGNPMYRRTRSFANAPASKFLNCGSGMTGPNADQMRLTIAIIAIVDPGKTAGTTTLRVGMAASAEDVIGQSRPPIACGSTGRLEAAIADLVKKQTGG